MRKTILVAATIMLASCGRSHYTLSSANIHQAVSACGSNDGLVYVEAEYRKFIAVCRNGARIHIERRGRDYHD